MSGAQPTTNGHESAAGRRSSVRLGHFSPSTHVIAHLSDTHLLADGAPLHGVVDTVSNLRRAADRLREHGERLDAIVVTGDVTDLGEADAYRRVRAELEPIADETGAALVWVMGNHDRRPTFRELLLDEHPSPADQSTVDRVVEVGGLRIISLDSSLAGYHHGELSDAQLEWLRGVLATPAEHGTILALHHPPLPTPLGAMTVLELSSIAPLAECIDGTDVRAVIAGHLHYPTSGLVGRVPVFVAGATSYTMDVGAPARSLRGIDASASFSLIHVYDETIVSSFVPLERGPVTTDFGPDLLDRLEAGTPEQRIELFSRIPGE